jgi:hypothetical protein
MALALVIADALRGSPPPSSNHSISERPAMTDEDEWRGTLAELPEWVYTRTDHPATYNDGMAADGTRL